MIHTLQTLTGDDGAKRLPNIEFSQLDTILALITLHLRQSLDIEEMLDTAVVEVQQFLLVDRTFIYQFLPGWTGAIAVESCHPNSQSLRGASLPRLYSQPDWIESYRKGTAVAFDDLQTAAIPAEAMEELTALGVRASLAVAIPQGKNLWGLLVLQQNSPRAWQSWEKELLEQLMTQIAIVVHQLSLLEQSQTELAERKEIEARLIHNALHDALTGLPNRVLFMERLNYAFTLARERSQFAFAVMFLDLDRFKVVNDGLGHHIGDRLLKVVSQLFRDCLRTTDTIARFGGDEFAVLLEDTPSIEVAAQIAERLLQILQQPFELEGYEVRTSVSIGIVMANMDYDNPEDLLRDADIAMYRAKQGGKAQYILFDTAMHAGTLTRLQLESDLRQAISRQEFRVHYQPILSLATNRITGFEALVRWQHPTRGLIYPPEFIAIAEETGAIAALGEWILREACRQIRAWQERFPSDPPLTIGVNVSSVQVMQANLVDIVLGVLNETQLAPNCLKLEITETVLMENLEQSRQRLETLRSLGIQVCIDDFGTGYSSFSYLQNLPVDVLKIDRVFISKLTEDENSQQIVRTILRLAHSMGMDIIAEGVETVEQLNTFEAMGSESVQGYCISRPLDSAAAAALIGNYLWK